MVIIWYIFAYLCCDNVFFLYVSAAIISHDE